VFFLLLLSLSEHVRFALAYLCASAACTGLLTFYGSFVLRGFGRAGARRGVGLLYGALYALLQMEQAALVLGSVLLFAVLAAVMIATRRIDWYAMATQLRDDALPARKAAAPGHGGLIVRARAARPSAVGTVRRSINSHAPSALSQASTALRPMTQRNPATDACASASTTWRVASAPRSGGGVAAASLLTCACMNAKVCVDAPAVRKRSSSTGSNASTNDHAEHRDREQCSRARHRVVDAGGDAGHVVLHRAHHGRRQGGPP
jgi:hypothetical protein